MLPVVAIAFLFLVLAAGSTGTYVAVTSASKKKTKFTGKTTSNLTSFDVVEDVVQQSPAQVQAAVSAKLGRTIPINVIALGTAIASESSGPYNAQLGIGWSVKNYAAKQGKSVLATVSPDGRFAAQGSANHGYISSRLPPTTTTIAIAESILATPPKVADPTKGAIQFDSPKAQRALLAQGRVTDTPEQVAASRIKSGRKMVTVPGVSADELRFWA